MSVTLQAAAAATGNGNPLDVAGAASATLQVSGTFVGTVIFEQTTDGVAWRRLAGIAAADGAAATQATAPGTFTAALAGATGVRARVSAYTSGAITVIGQAGAALPPLAADVPALTLSKISDAGTAAGKNTGTSSSTVAVGNHTHASAAALSDATPLIEAAVGAAGVSLAVSRDDHVHPAGAPDPLVLGDPTTGFSFPIPDADPTHTPYHLVVAAQPADSNNQAATMVIGCDDPSYALAALLAFGGTAPALLGISVGGGAGVQGIGSDGTGVFGRTSSGTAVQGTSTGSGYGVYGVSNSGIGVSAEAQGTGPAIRALCNGAGLSLDANKDIRIYTDTQGFVLTDRDTGDYYRLKVTAGVLGIELVS